MRLWTLFLLIFLFKECYLKKLNYPRILLPVFDKTTINFTVEVVEKGCFKWGTSSRYDLITVTPLYDNERRPECSYRARVTPISTEKKRNTAIVLAEDLSTGEVLRCDVILDVIDHLKVLTTTREFYLEDAPETFVLWAFDSQGNAFTSLEGVEFNWQIASQNYRSYEMRDGTWQQVLRFLTFAESPYHQVPKAVEKFESMGLKGYTVLLEGINTGTAKVIARLQYPEYAKVQPVEVDIMVVANIIIDPIDAFALVGDSIPFRILQLKQGKMQEISLNNQYYLEIENTSLATFSGNLAKCLIMGRTTVILRDRNVPKEISGDQDFAKITLPTASLTITEAKQIVLNLLPHYNWATVEGERHEIAADLYTVNDNKIILGSKYKINVDFDSASFYKLSQTQNGSRISGEAVKMGSSVVSATYNGLTASAELLIYASIELTPALVILPFDPNNHRRQKVQFKANGGDGTFTWSSQNLNAVHIDQNGLADILLDSIMTTEKSHDTPASKFAEIKVAMTRNQKLYKTAELRFLPPIKLEIVKYNFETALRDYVNLHIAIYTTENNTQNTLIPFTFCDNLDIKLDFSNEIFQVVDKNQRTTESLEQNACGLIKLKSHTLGQTSLKISYTFADRELKDEVTLVVFEKLNIFNPIENEIVLPIGSSRNLIYVNGPQRMFNVESELTKNMQFDKKMTEIFEIQNTDDTKDVHIFSVLCRKFGETQLDLKIFNSLNRNTFVPYLSNYVTKIHCVKPRFINIYTTEKLRESCPLKLKNSLMHVKQSDDNLEIGIEVLDAQNRRLMNITSLQIDWHFTQIDGIQHNRIFQKQEIEEEIVFGIRIPLRDYLIASVPGINHNFKIKAIVSSYNEQVLNSYGISPENPNFGVRKTATGPFIKPIIENELNFLAINSTLLPQNSISIFLAKTNVERVKLSQGSGFYDLNLSERGVVNVELNDSTKELIITPLRIGHTKLELVDRCLMSEPSHLFISVVSVGKIDVQTVDRVEKSKYIEAIVKLYDSMDNVLNVDVDNLDIYELLENVFNINILNVQLGPQNNLNPGEIRYHITGLEIGETKIVFYSGKSEKRISSQAVQVQVFSPLRLYPKNSTLIVGSSIQIYSEGGPHPDVNIVFTVQNENIISMDSSVAQGIKIGDTKIIGQSVGTNPSTGQQIVFSQDFVHLHVVPLESVRIKTPLTRIKSGAVMPATLWGVPGISPLILGTLPSLSVVWSTNAPDVISINGIFSDAGIEYDEYDSISVRVKALNPGKAQIKAAVRTPHGKFNIFVEIIVFKILELLSPKHITTDIVLLPPKATINLKANLNDVHYELENTTNRIVKVSKDGIVQTSDTIGRDLIIARTNDQILSIPIEVKNIHYVLTTYHLARAKLKHTETKIPRGMTMLIKITLHDNLGNEFSHNFDNINSLKHKLSGKEMAEIRIGENFTFGITVPRTQSGMLSISLKDTLGVKYGEDYIKLSVGQSNQIFPTQSTFSVGDIICFESPLPSSTNWISSDDLVIAVDNNFGIGSVLSSHTKFGEKVTVINGDPLFDHVKYDLEIREADTIEFIRKYDIFNGETYRGQLLIKNHNQFDKTTNLISKNATKCGNLIEKLPASFFTCRLKVSNQIKASILNNFKTVPMFDKVNGMYACEIQLLPSIAEFINILNNDELNLDLEAQLNNGILDSVTLKMVPAIKVFPLTIAIEELTKQMISVTGLDKVLQKVEVSSSNPSLLEIDLLSKAHGALQYHANLIGNYEDDHHLAIIIISPLTQQRINIDIRSAHAIMGKCTTQPFHSMSSSFLSIVSNLGLIITSLVVLAATIWAFVFCLSKRQQSVDASVFRDSFQNGKAKPSSPLRSDAFSSIRGPLYPPSPYFNTSNTSIGASTSSTESPIYGNAKLSSPQKRINRRFL